MSVFNATPKQKTPKHEPRNIAKNRQANPHLFDLRSGEQSQKLTREIKAQGASRYFAQSMRPRANT
jgi:hypothetical protein